MRNAYSNVAGIYCGMVPAATLMAGTTANPHMAERILKLPDGACILDAACGIGCDIIAIQNGLPDHGSRKSFNACASDASRPMVESAKANVAAAGTRFGIGAIDVRQCTFAELAGQHDWRGKFDLVIAPNAINTLPEDLANADYDPYIVQSFEGLRTVIRGGGVLMVDSRDWEKTVSLHFDRTMRENIHKGVTYRSEYTWNLGPAVDSEHQADMVISRKGDTATGCQETLRFAGRSLSQLVNLFGCAGFSIVNVRPQLRGLHNEPFVTFELALK